MQILRKCDGRESFAYGQFSMKQVGMPQMIGGDSRLEPFNWSLMPDDISKRRDWVPLSYGLAVFCGWI